MLIYPDVQSMVSVVMEHFPNLPNESHFVIKKLSETILSDTSKA